MDLRFSSMLNLLVFTVVLFGSLKVCTSSQPNIVFILTDDQDVTLGGLTPMAKARDHFTRNGMYFEHAFAHIPVCCPSRSSILTGKYQHNHLVLNNSLNGNCYGKQWKDVSEKAAFAVSLKQQNYTTFFAGKYLNQYGVHGNNATRLNVPPGWDVWNGLVGNSVYYNYELSVNGVSESHGDAAEDYLTDIIHDRAIDFIQSYQVDDEKPFFMMLATPACHDPFTASNKYLGRYADATVPITPNFEYKGGPQKHWLIRQTPDSLSNDTLNLINQIYGERWATLLTVDDIVADVVQVLTDKGIYDNTYVFYASDHGYHYGQFSLPKDKRQMYEFDIRIPFMVSGPDVPAGIVRMEPVVSVDLAPTFLSLAGISYNESDYDGISLAPLLRSENVVDGWRSTFLVEYHGEGASGAVPNCPQYGNHSGLGECKPDCICEDAWNNTFTCIRWLEVNGRNDIQCTFEDTEQFVEIYDLNADPSQLTNLAGEYSQMYKSFLRYFLKAITRKHT